MALRKNRGRKAAHPLEFIGPIAFYDIKHQGGRRIRHLSAEHSRYFIPDIIFWLHHLMDRGKMLRLMLFHPQKGRQGKPGKNTVSQAARDQVLRNPFIQIVTFFC